MLQKYEAADDREIVSKNVLHYTTPNNYKRLNQTLGNIEDINYHTQII